MEENLNVNSQVPVITPQSQPVKGNSKILVYGLVIVVLLVLGLGGVLFYLNSHMSSLKNPQTVVRTNVTPTPYVSNPNDTSNQAIDSDTQAAQNTLNSLNNDLNNADKSFNDQSVNLQ